MKPDSEPHRGSGDLSLLQAHAVLGAAFIGLCAFAAFHNSPRLWGLHYLAYLPSPIRIALLLAGAAACVPLVVRPAGALADGLVARIPSRLSKTAWAFLAVAVALLLWGFRDSGNLLGDGRLLSEGIEQGRWWVSQQSLDFAIHAAIHRVMRLFGASSGALTYALVSVVAGLLYVAAVAAFTGAIARSRIERIFMISILLCLGFVQVFFGYVESYSFTFPVALLYFLSAYRAMAGQEGLWKTVLLYVLLAFLHSTFVTYALSFGVVVFFSMRRRAVPAARALARAAAAAALLGIGVGATLFAVAEIVVPGDVAQRAADHTLPLFMSERVDRHVIPYAIVSSIHITNLVNEALLVVPGVTILALALVLVLVMAHAGRGLHSLPADRWALLLCACAAWVPHALGFLFFRPAYAAFGDWDLLALPTLAFAVSVATAAILFVSARRLAVLALATCGLQSLTVVPQILVNSDAERGAKRYLYLLREYPEAWDVFSAGIGYGNVMRHYSGRGDGNQVTYLGIESLRVLTWNPTIYEKRLVGLAERLVASGQTKEGLVFYRSRIDAVLPNCRDTPERVWVCKSAGEFFYNHEAFEDACRYFEMAAAADTSAYDALYALAAGQRQFGLFRQARESVTAAMRRTPEAETHKRAAGYAILASILDGEGQHEESMVALRKGLELEPANSQLRAALEEAAARNE